MESKDHNTVLVNPTASDICTTQTNIGWEHILKGRFSTLWNIHSVHPSHRTQHKTWTVEVIDCIFNQWWQLWTLRNQDRHGRDSLTRAQADTTQAHRELNLLYKQYKNIAPQTLQWLFDMDVHTKKQWSTSKLRQWLSTWQPVLEAKTRPQ